MKRSAGPRKTVNLSASVSQHLDIYALAASATTVSELSDSTHRQLGLYAVAASAAGMSLLALSQPCEGKIIYTRANLVIAIGTGVLLDLNHDGKTDFYIRDQTDYGKNTLCNVLPVGRNKMLGTANQAAALGAGVRIGPKGQFAASHTVLDRFWRKSGTGTSYSSGQWRNVKNRYLGLKFVIKGKIHYGWARMNISLNHSVARVVTGYAYETIPGKAIISGDIVGDRDRPEKISTRPPQPATPFAPVPESATLGLLAMGAPGLSIWRREPVGSLP